MHKWRHISNFNQWFLIFLNPIYTVNCYYQNMGVSTDVGKLINHNSFRDFISFKNFIFINKNNNYSGKIYFMSFFSILIKLEHFHTLLITLTLIILTIILCLPLKFVEITWWIKTDVNSLHYYSRFRIIQGNFAIDNNCLVSEIRLHYCISDRVLISSE